MGLLDEVNLMEIVEVGQTAATIPCAMCGHGMTCTHSIDNDNPDRLEHRGPQIGALVICSHCFAILQLDTTTSTKLCPQEILDALSEPERKMIDDVLKLTKASRALYNKAVSDGKIKL